MLGIIRKQQRAVRRRQTFKVSGNTSKTTGGVTFRKLRNSIVYHLSSILQHNNSSRRPSSILAVLATKVLFKGPHHLPDTHTHSTHTHPTPPPPIQFIYRPWNFCLLLSSRSVIDQKVPYCCCCCWRRRNEGRRRLLRSLFEWEQLQEFGLPNPIWSAYDFFVMALGRVVFYV